MILYAKTKHKKLVPTFFPHQSPQEGTESEVLHLEDTEKASNTGGHGWTALCRGPLDRSSLRFSMITTLPHAPLWKMMDSVNKTTKMARELVNAYVSS